MRLTIPDNVVLHHFLLQTLYILCFVSRNDCILMLHENVAPAVLIRRRGWLSEWSRCQGTTLPGLVSARSCLQLQMHLSQLCSLFDDRPGLLITQVLASIRHNGLLVVIDNPFYFD